MLWWVDLKKVAVAVAAVVAIVVAFIIFLHPSEVRPTPPAVVTQTPTLQQKVDYTAKLRVVGEKCVIRVDVPPVPYDITWPWIHPNFTLQGAGGYYAYLLLINETKVAIAPTIARAYNASLYFVFKCTVANGAITYQASPTFVNKTAHGFNEQYTVGVEFGECAVDYCEFGWRTWQFVAKRAYVFLNWYYTPVNGYALPAIGGVPYEVVFPQ